ncbi:cytochrome P460 family protein [Candidatus Poribacteria bacterium]|nr:cytochrome P460 family protein [Candidatus Poribacteria bacterium]
MKTQKNNLRLLSILSRIVFIVMFCILFTSCVEEQQIEELVQEVDNGENTQEPQQIDETLVALPGLPDYTAGYDKWLKLNAEPIPPVPGGDPHNGTKNVYVNQERVTIAPDGEQTFPYPDGSIVVKEATRPNKDYIGLIAIMRKVAGSDPDHNDWEFIEYTRNDPDDDFTILARDRVCWGCHARVEDLDYVFTTLD